MPKKQGSETPLADAVERLFVGEKRREYVEKVLTPLQKKAREQAMETTLKAYAALPLAWRKAIAEEAGSDILKLSRASNEQRRELQKAARRIADRSGMSYMEKAHRILTKSCVE